MNEHTAYINGDPSRASGARQGRRYERALGARWAVADDARSGAPSGKAEGFGERERRRTSGPRNEHSRGMSDDGWTVAGVEGGGKGRRIVDGGAEFARGI
jgi:hypothetical protein